MRFCHRPLWRTRGVANGGVPKQVGVGANGVCTTVRDEFQGRLSARTRPMLLSVLDWCSIRRGPKSWRMLPYRVLAAAGGFGFDQVINPGQSPVLRTAPSLTGGSLRNSGMPYAILTDDGAAGAPALAISSLGGCKTLQLKSPCSAWDTQLL